MNKMIFLLPLFSAAAVFCAEPLFKPGTLYSSYRKTAGFFNSKFNGKTINAIAYNTGSGTCKSEPNPQYEKKETADGILYIFKRRFLLRKGDCIGNEKVTVLVKPESVVVSTTIDLTADLEIDRYSSFLFQTVLSFLNVSNMREYGIEGQKENGQIYSGSIPEKFIIGKKWHMSGFYKSLRFGGPEDSILFTAGENALVHIGSAYGKSIEIYSSMKANNPNRRPLVLKKGTSYHWTANIYFEKYKENTK